MLFIGVGEGEVGAGHTRNTRGNNGLSVGEVDGGIAVELQYLATLLLHTLRDVRLV